MVGKHAKPSSSTMDPAAAAAAVPVEAIAYCSHNRGHTCLPSAMIDAKTGKVHTRCAFHRAQSRRYMKAYRAKAVADRVCTRCGTGLGKVSGYALCKRCRTRYRNATRLTREKTAARARRAVIRREARKIETCTDARLINQAAERAALRVDPTRIRVAAVVRKATFLGHDTLTAAERMLLKKATVSSTDEIGVPE